jgi:hypothetical protein
MSRTFKHRRDELADMDAMVRRSAARRSARKLAEMAWGGATIAEQDYQVIRGSCAHA